MALNKIDSFPFGQGKYMPVDYAGPASYLITGDPIGVNNNQTGIAALGLSTIDNIEAAGFSISGAYQVFAQPTGKGSRKVWAMLWNGLGGVVSVTATAGTGMTPGTYPLVFTGGGGTGAAGTITVLTATTVSAPVITSSGRGYTTAPTVTAPATGGTPPTFGTPVLNAVGPVAAATDLSAETVRIAIIGR